MKDMIKVTMQLGTTYTDIDGVVCMTNEKDVRRFIRRNILGRLTVLNGGYVTTISKQLRWTSEGERVVEVQAICPDISDLEDVWQTIADEYEEQFKQESTVFWFEKVQVKL